MNKANGKQIVSGNFTFTDTSIEGVKVIEVRSYGDARGSFMETYKREDFEAGGITVEFVQDNQSASIQGVLRGLHFQIEHPQSKLVRVIRGAVFDVCVDLRQGSATFGRWEGVELSAENRRQFYIPRGFAHGYLALTENVLFAYKCDDTYRPNDEGGLMWDDPSIGVEWPALKGHDVFDSSALILSEKDRRYPSFEKTFGGVR